MTNEQRRGVSNLMLMCYKHHQVTNNAKKVPVAKLGEGCVRVLAVGAIEYTAWYIFSPPARSV